jgi:hypothetical protein
MAASSLSFRSAGCRPRKSNILSVLLAVVLPGLAPLHAQQNDVSMKIDVVAWGDEIGGLSFKSGDKKGGITALSFRYSDPVSYNGPAVMEIFKNGNGTTKPKPVASEEDLKHELMPLVPQQAAVDKTAPAKQGIALELENRRKKTPDLVALAALPSGCVRATILLAPASDGTFVAYVIDDDPSKLPLGQLRVHNLSPNTIALRCNGGGPKELKTREAFVVPVTNQQISYDLAYQVGTEWKFQEHNYLPIFAKDQTQMIILKSSNSFFLSSDGSSGGFLQVVMLRRSK